MQKYIVTALVIALIAFGIFTGWKIDSLQDKLAIERNRIARTDTITIIDTDSTIFRKAAEVAEKLRIKDIENEDLKRDLKVTKSKIRSLTELLAAFETNIDSITTTPSITMGDSVREFKTQKDSLTMAGHFYTVPPYTLSIDKIRLSLGLNVYITESKNGTWNTYVETKTPGVLLSQINTKVAPYHRSWYNRLYLLGEISLLSAPDVGVGIGYEKWGHFVFALDETGARTVRVGKAWYIFGNGK
jgi:hypothetical protein